MATAQLPNLCFFTAPPPNRPKIVDVQAALAAAGFSDVTTTGSGSYCSGVGVTPPGSARVPISPGSGQQSGTQYDTASRIDLAATASPS